MKNTTHFGITSVGQLIVLGVGANTAPEANLLADHAETVAMIEKAPIHIPVLLDIEDLYRLRDELTNALNNLDNDAMTAEVIERATE